MAVKATDLRKGTVIVGDHGKLLLITEYHHHTPGNLRAVIHLKVRDVQTGVVTPMRLSSSDSFEVAYLDKKKCEYLYKESSGNYVFMDQTTFEQFPLSEELVGDKMGFVRENFGLRGDVRYFRSVQDSDLGDDIDFDFGSFDFWRATVGATFRF